MTELIYELGAAFAIGLFLIYLIKRRMNSLSDRPIKKPQESFTKKAQALIAEKKKSSAKP